jgi:hypothetical protein
VTARFSVGRVAGGRLTVGEFVKVMRYPQAAHTIRVGLRIQLRA